MRKSVTLMDWHRAYASLPFRARWLMRGIILLYVGLFLAVAIRIIYSKP